MTSGDREPDVQPTVVDMEREIVKLTEARATALLTLFARARQSRSANPVLADPWAEQALERIAYPFDQRPGGEWRDRLLAARARLLDAWTRDFLAEHPRALPEAGSHRRGSQEPGEALRAGLVDDLHVFVVSMLIGAGHGFLPSGIRVQLNLRDERRFQSGVVYLRYVPQGSAG